MQKVYHTNFKNLIADILSIGLPIKLHVILPLILESIAGATRITSTLYLSATDSVSRIILGVVGVNIIQYHPLYFSILVMLMSGSFSSIFLPA
jgi:hypothetical protein